MLHDTTLDDGPMLIDNPQCLHEDRNAILVIHDDALIHESPILFLKYPTYTVEEKYAYVEKYLCGLQLSYEKSYCNHDAMIKNDICNYFERGKYANEFLNESNDPLYVPKIPKLHDSNIHTIEFTLVIATTIKEGVISTIFMLLVMILYVHLMIICNGMPLLAII
jgi:hypothetical protein